MKIFSALYDKCLIWAKHKYAIYYLAGLSFLESIIFPVPVDVILAPMVLAERKNAWRYALITTVCSVVGGVVGFFLGWWLLDSFILPLIEQWGYTASYDKALNWFTQYGVWVVFIAGFSPIPYKVFTVSAGGLHMAFLPFLIASFVGRAGRFFLVAALVYYGGPTIENKLKQYIDWIGWFIVAAIVIFLVLRHY